MVEQRTKLLLQEILWMQVYLRLKGVSYWEDLEDSTPGSLRLWCIEGTDESAGSFDHLRYPGSLIKL